MLKKTSKSLAISAALLLSAPLSMAQSEQGFSDEKLSKYAQARSEIQAVSKSYRSKMQEAEDQKAAQEMRKEMQDEMMTAVKDNGLSVEEYNEITKAVRQDEELRQKVRSMEGGGTSQNSSGNN